MFDIDEAEDEEDKDYYLNWYKYVESVNFETWVEEVHGVAMERNISNFAISLAKENNIKLSEFMKKYQ